MMELVLCSVCSSTMYGTEQFKGIVYKELKGEYVQINDCKDLEKGVSKKDNVKEIKQEWGR